eukprot:m.137620 g.137620  ORF g.137620 m.137620 type:complete len:1028 (-) comp16058_c0_seq6:267-3350(-)
MACIQPASTSNRIVKPFKMSTGIELLSSIALKDINPQLYGVLNNSLSLIKASFTTDTLQPGHQVLEITSHEACKEFAHLAIRIEDKRTGQCYWIYPLLSERWSFFCNDVDDFIIRSHGCQNRLEECMFGDAARLDSWFSIVEQLQLVESNEAEATLQPIMDLCSASFVKDCLDLVAFRRKLRATLHSEPELTQDTKRAMVVLLYLIENTTSSMRRKVLTDRATKLLSVRSDSPIKSFLLLSGLGALRDLIRVAGDEFEMLMRILYLKPHGLKSSKSQRTMLFHPREANSGDDRRTLTIACDRPSHQVEFFRPSLPVEAVPSDKGRATTANVWMQLVVSNGSSEVDLNHIKRTIHMAQEKEPNSRRSAKRFVHPSRAPSHLHAIILAEKTEDSISVTADDDGIQALLQSDRRCYSLVTEGRPLSTHELESLALDKEFEVFSITCEDAKTVSTFQSAALKMNKGKGKADMLKFWKGKHNAKVEQLATITIEHGILAFAGRDNTQYALRMFAAEDEFLKHDLSQESSLILVTEVEQISDVLRKTYTLPDLQPLAAALNTLEADTTWPTNPRAREKHLSIAALRGALLMLQHLPPSERLAFIDSEYAKVTRSSSQCTHHVINELSSGLNVMIRELRIRASAGANNLYSIIGRVLDIDTVREQVVVMHDHTQVPEGASLASATSDANEPTLALHDHLGQATADEQVKAALTVTKPLPRPIETELVSTTQLLAYTAAAWLQGAMPEQLEAPQADSIQLAVESQCTTIPVDDVMPPQAEANESMVPTASPVMEVTLPSLAQPQAGQGYHEDDNRIAAARLHITTPSITIRMPPYSSQDGREDTDIGKMTFAEAAAAYPDASLHDLGEEAYAQLQRDLTRAATRGFSLRALAQLIQADQCVAEVDQGRQLHDGRATMSVEANTLPQQASIPSLGTPAVVRPSRRAASPTSPLATNKLNVMVDPSSTAGPALPESNTSPPISPPRPKTPVRGGRAVFGTHRYPTRSKPSMHAPASAATANTLPMMTRDDKATGDAA